MRKGNSFSFFVRCVRTGSENRNSSILYVCRTIIKGSGITKRLSERGGCDSQILFFLPRSTSSSKYVYTHFSSGHKAASHRKKRKGEVFDLNTYSAFYDIITLELLGLGTREECPSTSGVVGYRENGLRMLKLTQALDPNAHVEAFATLHGNLETK